MTIFAISQPAAKAAGLMFLIGLTACATKPRQVRAPSLQFNPTQTCTSKVDFTTPVTREADEKKQKKEMSRRTIELTKNMADAETPCLTLADGKNVPYRVFEIPSNIEGRVVSAGSKIASAVIFAGDIETYDANGVRVRSFEKSEYRRLGTIYGVQFSPMETEAYILMIANPQLIGERDVTVETATALQTVSFGTGTGTNTVASQRRFDRVYSYNGEVAVRTVFPKQKDK